MKQLLAIICICLLPQCVPAQQLNPFQDTRSKKWGYKNEKGSVVIPPRFDDAALFSEGLAKVKVNTRWGFIDRTGKEVVPCKYTKTGAFHDGRAWVYNAGSAFYIDKTGKKVFELSHANINILHDYSEGLVSVWVYRSSKNTRDRWGYYDTTGKLVIPDQFEDASDFKSGIAVVAKPSGYTWEYGAYGAIDKTGKEIIPFRYNQGLRPFSFDERGLARVELDGKYIYIDRTGKEVKRDTLDEGFDPINQVRITKSGSLFGLADKSGKTIIPVIYDKLEINSYDKLVFVTKNGKTGMYNTKGTLIIPVKYDYIGPFFGGIAPIQSDDKWGMIHSSGREIVPPRYDNIDGAGYDISTVTLKGKKGLIDKTGKQLAPPIYDEIDAKFWENEFGVVSLGKKKGVICKTGKLIVPVKYKEIVSDLKKGPFTAYDENYDWYVYDKTGKMIVPPGKYQEYKIIGPLIFARKSGDKYAVLDQTGKEWIPKKYNNVLGLNEGFAKVDSGKKYALFSLSAKKELTGFIYDDIKPVSGNAFIVKTGNKFGLAGSTGNLLAEIKYDEIISINSTLFKVKANGKWGLMNASGKELTKIEYFIINAGQENWIENEIMARLTPGGPMEYYDMNGNKIEE